MFLHVLSIFLEQGSKRNRMWSHTSLQHRNTFEHLSDRVHFCDFQPLVGLVWTMNMTQHDPWPISAKRLGLQREPFCVFHDESTVIRTQAGTGRRRTQQVERYEKRIRCQSIFLGSLSFLCLIHSECVGVLYRGLQMMIELGMHPMMWTIDRCWMMFFTEIPGTVPEANSYRYIADGLLWCVAKPIRWCPH